jgi:hypothetical protein
MVSATINIGTLISLSWNTNFNLISDNGDLILEVYLPDKVTRVLVKLDDASKEALITKRNQCKAQVEAFLSQKITLSGTLLETCKLQDVVIPASTTKDWVKQ